MSASRAGQALQARMDQLALSQVDLAKVSGLSTRTISDLTGGLQRGYQGKTITLIERAVDWPLGTLRALLDEDDQEALA